MVTNVSVGPVDSVAVVYLQDGSSTTVASGETRSLQVIDNGICTVSDAVSHDEDEHMSPEERAVVFAERMIAFWVGLADKAREKALGPTATPL
jgi:hypothetical protein